MTDVKIGEQYIFSTTPAKWLWYLGDPAVELVEIDPKGWYCKVRLLESGNHQPCCIGDLYPIDSPMVDWACPYGGSVKILARSSKLNTYPILSELKRKVAKQRELINLYETASMRFYYGLSIGAGSVLIIILLYLIISP